MKTIAICNHKGGVGKTALSMAIAEGLHRKGKRTLLVDLDQQMNATQQAKIDEELGGSCSLPALRRYSSCRCAVLPGLRQGDLEVG